MPSPDVSVVVAAYNALPYLRECVDSVLRQSIGTERMELIVVDDGSTDGSAAVLDEYAAAHPAVMRVTHQPNSGGPAAPRNAGMDLAQGKYVFFLDADDYLGDEALERLVAMAEANDADITLAKMKGVNGRGVAASMYKEDQPDADLFDSRVYWTLATLKLFRRDFLAEHGLRLDPSLPVGEDQPFTARAYLAAKRISVLASYDCYFARLREDGQNTTTKEGGAIRRLPFLKVMFEEILPLVEEGPKRDLLARRHLHIEQRDFLFYLAAEPDGPEKRAAFETFAGWVRAHLTPGSSEPLHAYDRVRLALVAAGHMDAAIALRLAEENREPYTAVVEDGRAYAAWAPFRAGLGVPDEAFEITREIGLRQTLDTAAWSADGYTLSGTATMGPVVPDGGALLVRARAGEPAHEVPASIVDGTWTATIPADLLGSLDEGFWDVSLRVNADGLSRLARVGRHGTADLGDAPAVCGPRGLAAYATEHGNLSFDVGLKRRASREALGLTGAWKDGVEVHAVAPHGAGPDIAVRLLYQGGGSRAVPTLVTPEGTVSAFVPAAELARLDLGVWRVAVSFTGGGGEVTLPVPHRAGLPKRVDVRATGVLITHVDGGLAVNLVRIPVKTRVKRMAKRLIGK
ncbi:glycosyl transferase [Actinorhabdospora filicis]|uniref:Glycosyl transferase n=1 Tax=Actinorhabdospora filicis TaxID=1785913 RepID=A0A9W6ST67_9ACTN|nr:glycosyltransferase [Actinorhabdospora filicis]GLZ81888.1 glycosyl transferase [Actinorhabdospora filicis]